VESKHGVDEHASTAFGCDRLRHSNKMDHLAEPVHEDKNTIILVVIFG
jgi:hypothetical protein